MDHYYSEKQNTKFEPFLINISTKKDSFEIFSASGVFSKDKLDNATGLLLESLLDLSGKKVLDIGCGYGVVGIYVLRNNHGSEVVFSDINERALKLVRMNLKKHELKAKIIKSDLFSKVNDSFDFILSNPPFAAGRDVCYNLINGAYEKLDAEGQLLIVGRHNKGGAMLQKHMEKVFGNVSVLKKGSGFRVYCSKK